MTARALIGLAGVLAVIALPAPSLGQDAGGGVDAGAGGEVERGRVLYERFGCPACHLHSGAGYEGTPGGARLVPMRLTRETFTVYLRNPPVPQRMPPYTASVLTDDEAAAIHAFIRSLPAPAAGAAIPELDAIVEEIRGAE